MKYSLNILKFCELQVKLTDKRVKFSKLIPFRKIVHSCNTRASATETLENHDFIIVDRKEYVKDGFTNVTPHVLNYMGRDLHLTHNHPLNLLKKRIVNFMYGKYVNRRGNPLFSVYDKLHPVVTTDQNFDSLLFPVDHVSRKKSDTYFVNQSHVLRTHTSAHQKELLMSGLDNFLVIGDVYRRDEIDCTHFPVFHQAEGVRLFSNQELFLSVQDGDCLQMFQKGVREPMKQETHTLEAVKILEVDLKNCLSSLVQRLFGTGIEYKWTDSYFPFTHPSWELEVLWDGKWLEVLGCGIMEQDILCNAGAGDKIGWAFGLGLERLAMMLFGIPDIRLFWSQDTGFLSQFNVEDSNTNIKYKAVSKYPQCINDISFWVPENFHVNDFYDVARSVGGPLIEQVQMKDEFFHPKHKKRSFCFRIVYRDMERTLTQSEVSAVHRKIEENAKKELKVEIR